MALAGPQGTVRYPIRAPNEHSPRTEIMEKSLALFFYCYQSVVHLQSSLSPSLHSPQLSVFFFFSFRVLFTLHPSTAAPLRPSYPASCFPHLFPRGRVICWVQKEGGGWLYPSKPPYYLPRFFSSVLSVSLFSPLCSQSSVSALHKNGATKARETGAE